MRVRWKLRRGLERRLRKILRNREDWAMLGGRSEDILDE